MTAVPTYNFILNKVDSLTRLTDSILSVQLMQNAKMDSVCDIASQLSETQIALQSQTETVSVFVTHCISINSIPNGRKVMALIL